MAFWKCAPCARAWVEGRDRIHGSMFSPYGRKAGRTRARTKHKSFRGDFRRDWTAASRGRLVIERRKCPLEGIERSPEIERRRGAIAHRSAERFGMRDRSRPICARTRRKENGNWRRLSHRSRSTSIVSTEARDSNARQRARVFSVSRESRLAPYPCRSVPRFFSRAIF
jgi:hypothetical protein